MDNYLQADLKHTASLLEKITVQSIAYLHDISNRSTSSSELVEITDQLKSEGIGTENALQQFNERFEKIIGGFIRPKILGFCYRRYYAGRHCR